MPLRPRDRRFRPPSRCPAGAGRHRAPVRVRPVVSGRDRECGRRDEPPLHRAAAGKDPGPQRDAGSRDAVPECNEPLADRMPDRRNPMRRAGASRTRVPSGLREQRLLLHLLHGRQRRQHGGALQGLFECKRGRRRERHGSAGGPRPVHQPQRRPAPVRPRRFSLRRAGRRRSGRRSAVPRPERRRSSREDPAHRRGFHRRGAVRPAGPRSLRYPVRRTPTPRARTRCREIWAFGMRNPWRFSFDRAGGDLYIGDVGQEQLRGDRLSSRRRAPAA